MARAFINDATDNNTVKLATTGLTAWTFGTWAACVLVTGIHASNFRQILVFGADAQDFGEWGYTDAGTGAKLYKYDGVTNSVGATGIAISKWYVLAVTKASGTVGPRAHIFDFAVGTWTHEAMAPAIADGAATGATEIGIGFAGGLGGFGLAADVVAEALWSGREMTDSEIERLPAGRWDRWTPDVDIEFASGRDLPARTTIDFGRMRMRQTTLGSGVTTRKGNNPPGFRMAGWTRRR